MTKLIGTEPNQVPTNGDLGTLAYQDAENVSVGNLTATKLLTYAPGTANGVAYLDGSKVVTSGSALTFDGATLNAIRFQASDSVAISTLNQLTLPARAEFTNNGGTLYVGLDSAGGGLGGAYTANFWHSGNYPIVFATNNAEQMRLTSTGLGIGTSSPATKLDVNGDGTFRNGGGTIVGNVQNSAGWYDFKASVNVNGAQISTAAATPIRFMPNDVERMRLDASGNLGLGVVPSAWATGYWAIQVQKSAFFGTTSRDTNIGSNVYVDAVGYKYIDASFANLYLQYQGAHSWSTAPSGTAGAAISFTQAMTLDASGRLVVGGTSAASSTVLTLQETAGLGAALSMVNRNSTQTWRVAVDASAVDDKMLAFIDSATSVVRMALTDTGNLLVGTTLNVGARFYSYKVGDSDQLNSRFLTQNTANTVVTFLDVGSNPTNNTCYIDASGTNNTSLVLRTDGLERARIDSSGNLGIGTTTPGFKLEVNGSFAATTKSFVIDHPTNPSMKLRYGSLEGPENGVYVRGKLTKQHTIELPEYWTKLVDPDTITVSLTSVGKHQNLYVEDIKDNVIYIGNDNLFSKEINCFYVVYGERCDVEKLQVEIPR